MMLARMRDERCLSDLRLDELMFGELDPRERLQADAHLATCARCADRLAELGRDRAAFVPVPLAPPVSRVPRLSGLSRLRWRELVFGLAAAAAVVLFFIPPWSSGQGERSKGGAHLELLVSHRGETRAAGPGERVQGGDALTFVVTTQRPAFVSVLGLDGEDKISVYVVNEAVEAGSDRSLPNAALLDATPGIERIYGVFCETRVDLEVLRRDLGLEPPAGCTVDVAAVEKAP